VSSRTARATQRNPVSKTKQTNKQTKPKKKRKFGYKYLLVFIDTFSRWTETFSTKHKTVQIVTKKLLKEILPRFGFSKLIGSDNGPAFVSQVS
jgi:nucleoside-specific outer membrane channel protein Tsx